MKMQTTQTINLQPLHTMLTQFNKPAILKGIGTARLARFFEGFSSELNAANVVLPAHDSANGSYFDSLAAVLAAPANLPERLCATLFALEEAASPANLPRLQDAICRRHPRVCLPGLSAVDQALELWFLAPDELSQVFPPVPPGSRSTASAIPAATPVVPSAADGGLSAQSNAFDQSATQHPETSIQNPPVGIQHPASSIAPTNPSIHQSTDPSAPPSPAQPSTINSQPSTDSQSFQRLALLSPTEYDRARHAEAIRLGIRKETLDAEVARCRRQANSDTQGTAVELAHIEPWPEPVDGPETLNQVAARFAQYLVLPPGAAMAMTLWTTHCHAIAAFRQTPRLNLYSPDPGCGKTTALDVLASLTPRPLRTENLTSPVLSRLVDQHQPTLLLDEVDAYLNQADELRGLLNAGHKRGACAYRCEGEGNTVRAFQAFAPAALAGIGRLPGTLHDRSIQIPLVEAEPGELAASFDSLHTEVETVLCRKLARWAQDNFAALQSCDPALPATAFNRLADNWRPLFAIAQVAGGDWPRLAAEAFASLSAKEGRDGEGLGRLLLADIRQIFAQRGSDRLSSTQLVDCLCALADRPWREAQQGGKPINEIWLGRRLGRCGVRSHNIRLGDRQAKGYEFGDFAEAFDRLEEGEAD